MLNTQDTINLLSKLGLTPDEAKIYHHLLRFGRESHLQISKKTGINRTTAYRIVSDLEKRSLVNVVQSDEGKFVEAGDPTKLEIGVVNAEQKASKEREIFSKSLPDLLELQEQSDSPLNFVVRTYDGVDGFKQMLWNELKAKDEILIFGSGRIEDLVESKQWSEKHRLKTTEFKYKVRELLNPKEKPVNFTKIDEFHKFYIAKYVERSVLPLYHQIAIYNDTVSTYCWRDGQKVGLEIINKANSDMYRALFESFWKIAQVKA